MTRGTGAGIVTPVKKSKGTISPRRVFRYGLVSASIALGVATVSLAGDGAKKRGEIRF